MNNDAHAPGPDQPQQPYGGPNDPQHGQPPYGQPYGQDPRHAPYGQYPQQPYQQPYGQPQYPAAMPLQNEPSTAMWTHLGPLLVALVTSGSLGFIVPLVMWLSFRDRSHFVAEHAKESLNFQITLAIVLVVSIPLMFVIIGIFTALAALICALVFMIQGSMAAHRGEYFRYPVNIRFIR